MSRSGGEPLASWHGIVRSLISRDIKFHAREIVPEREGSDISR